FPESNTQSCDYAAFAMLVKTAKTRTLKDYDNSPPRCWQGVTGSQGARMANGRPRTGSGVARLSLLLTIAVAAPAWSQVQTGRIVGNVRDSQQAIVPRAN